MYPTLSCTTKTLKASAFTSLLFLVSVSALSVEQNSINSHSVKPQAEGALALDVKTYSADSRCVQISWISHMNLPKNEFEFLPNTLSSEKADNNCSVLWQGSSLNTPSTDVYYLVSGELLEPFTVELNWQQNGNGFSASASWPAVTPTSINKARNFSINNLQDSLQNSEFHIIKIGGAQ